MAKLDKEALIKHRFWIGLGVGVFLCFVAIIVIMLDGDPNPQKKWEDAKKAGEAEKQKGPKTVAYQIPWNEHGKMFSDWKDVIWKQAWDAQSVIYTWPADMPVVPLYPEDAFGPTTTEDQNNRGRFRNEYYEPQFDDLEKDVSPVEFAGGFNAVFPKQEWSRTKEPTREEIWLAQEDFWVRREMLSIIYMVLSKAAEFKEAKLDPKEKLPEGVEAQHLFRNGNWEIKLLLVKGDNRRLKISKNSTIKNINATGKTLPLANPVTNEKLVFRIFQGDNRPYELHISGEPVVQGDETKFLPDDVQLTTVDLTKQFGIAQVLDWETSPIRRIDALNLAHHSHRTAPWGLKARDDLKKLDMSEADLAAAKDATNKTAATPAAGSKMPGSGSGMPGLPSGSSQGLPGAQPSGSPGRADAGDDVTPVNGIKRARYMHVTAQCRHLPIAMRLVVDQAHIQDVKAAMANSLLRIQITQSESHHLENVKRQAGAAAEGPGPVIGPPKAGGPPRRPGGAGGKTGVMAPPGGGSATYGPQQRPGNTGGMVAQYGPQQRMPGLGTMGMGGPGRTYGPHSRYDAPRQRHCKHRPQGTRLDSVG